MSFKKNKYTVLKNAVSPEIAEFVYKYFCLNEFFLNLFFVYFVASILFKLFLILFIMSPFIIR